jgi:hypothetical protein
MTTQLTFDEWWEDFLAAGHPRDDFYQMQERFFHYMEPLPPSKLGAFTSELVTLAMDRGHRRDLALKALEYFGGREDRRRLHSAATRLYSPLILHPGNDYRESILRVLESDSTSEFVGPVEEYLRQAIGLSYTSVVWSLWPHRRDLFARYHARYFAEVRPDAWAGTAEIQAFIWQPDALVAVRDVLMKEDRWNLELRSGIGPPSQRYHRCRRRARRDPPSLRRDSPRPTGMKS